MIEYEDLNQNSYAPMVALRSKLGCSFDRGRDTEGQDFSLGLGPPTGPVDSLVAYCIIPARRSAEEA